MSIDFSIFVLYLRIMLVSCEEKNFEWSYLIKHCSHCPLLFQKIVQMAPLAQTLSIISTQRPFVCEMV